jgi:hypothetical protein
LARGESIWRKECGVEMMNVVSRGRYKSSLPNLEWLKLSSLTTSDQPTTIDDVNMLEDRTKLYIGISFVAGILITLGFKDVYPDLERRYRQRLRRLSTTNPEVFAKVGEKVSLKDNTDRPENTDRLPDIEIPEGIEGCIGNTPLFKIKSLSAATGCEILAKAEVSFTACSG